MSPDKVEIGRRIRLLRKQLGYTQDELAQRMRRFAPADKRVPRNAISQWENGVFQPDTWTVTATAKALGTSVAFLIGETDDPSPTRRPALTPDPVFWSVVRQLNGQPPYLQKLAAQLIETMLTYARDYGAWANSAPLEIPEGARRAQELAEWVEQPVDQLLLETLLQSDPGALDDAVQSGDEERLPNIDGAPAGSNSHSA